MLPIFKQLEEVFRGPETDDEVDDEVDDETNNKTDEEDDEDGEHPDTTVCLIWKVKDLLNKEK